MIGKEELISIFEDTKSLYETDPVLKESVRASKDGTHIYYEQDMPKLSESKPCDKTEIKVTKSRSFEAAMRLKKDYPDCRIAVHNFASATNPGGGVTKGSRAQEECLCRCSTLYPVLNTESNWNGYYGFHRNRHDVRYTDACIYTPGIMIIKSDTDVPERLPKDDWCEVDVLTCAAPNLRPMPNNPMNPGNDIAVRLSDKEVLQIHLSRARHLLQIAAANGDEVLVLGAFGCGAFQNKPEIVAQAYKEVMPEFEGYFKIVEFAVYCSPRDESNFVEFKKVLGGSYV